MTAAECEIVADAGRRLREIALRALIPGGGMNTIRDIHEVYGMLAILPLTAEGEEA